MTLIQTTDPQGEQLTLVDSNNNVIGSISRHDAHSTSGVNYRTIYILVFDQDGKVLLQKRSSTKDLYPECWDLSVGGHVNFGQSYEETAVREIHEELGLQINQADLITKGDVTVHLPTSNEYFRVFEYHLKPDENITASPEEINDTRWMTMDEIKASITNKSLAWYTRPEQTVNALY